MASISLPACVRPANPMHRIGRIQPQVSLPQIAASMLAPSCSPIAAEMARFAALTEAWGDMADAARCQDERDYRAAKARFCAAAEAC